ncbi:MAG TPA: MetQ/NlpA family ABC transporter substrate-binding protein, partial [Tissierellaceae bacterium]
KLGVNSDEMEVWNYIKNELKKDNVNLEIITFNDYTRPNLALAERDIDINSFQHYAFFNKFIANHNLDLTSIGETIIAPLGIYSEKINSLSEVKINDVVAIPNDETNGGRALNLLQSAGLLKLESKELPTVDDILENKLNLDILEVDAAMVPRTLKDVDIAIINSGFAVDAGYLPTDDSIFLEDINEDTNPYINIFAVRTEDKDDLDLLKIVEIYQTKEVEEIINRVYKGSQKIAW